MKKLISILVAFAMMATLAVTMAFAEGATGIKGTEAQPAKINLTKTLKAPEGSNPASEFTFVITDLTEYAEGTAAEDKATIGAAKKATFAADAEGTGSGLVTYTQTVEDVLGNVSFPAAGVYTLKVEEQNKGQTIPTTVDKVTTTIKYSNASYVLKVGVATKANGDRYVDAIALYDAANTNAKVDPATFGFENELSQKIDNTTYDPQNPDTWDDALEIDKAVTGTNASTTQLFSFKLSMNRPANVSEEQTYYYDIVGQDGTVLKDHQSITTGTPDETIQLKAGDRIVFEKIDVGASYILEEAKYPAWTSDLDMTDAAYINVAGNTQTVTNTYDETEDPATGLSMANLPFIVLALVAIGGLAAYVIVRRKSEDNA